MSDWKANTVLQNTPILVGDKTIPGVDIPDDIQAIIPTVFKAADDFGLDYYDTIIEWMTYDGISEVAAYDGFPQRYPHWRFGMSYEELSKGFEFGSYRIYELVVNTDPCRIYCLNSNSFTDNVTVIGHALGHNHFFKNNIFFKGSNTNMINEFGNNRTRVMEIEGRWGEDAVEAFIDDCLAVENLIDPVEALNCSEYKDRVVLDERRYEFPRTFKVRDGHDYMHDWINPKEWIDEEWGRIKKEERKRSLGIVEMRERDVVKFLLEHAPLKPWEHAVLEIIYNEAKYFAPQGMTQVGNEGFACTKWDTLVPTSNGFVKVKEIVDNKFDGSVDGGKVTNWFKFKDKKTLLLKTRRGLELEGSVTHRLKVGDDWKRLDEFKVGDSVELSIGGNVWASEEFKLDWKPQVRMTIDDICEKLDVCHSTFSDYRYKRRKVSRIKNKDEADRLLNIYKNQVATLGKTIKTSKPIKCPEVVDEKLASFLGYMVGDGHISVKGRSLGLTTGDESQADNYMRLVKDLFGLDCGKEWDDTSKNGRWRITVHSKNLQDFLISLGMPTGVCARIKTIPDCVLKSPKNVMSAFLRSYLDCDGGAYEKNGVIISTSSTQLAKTLQVVLMNYGILNRRHLKDHGNWHIVVTGRSAELFLKEIGFGLERKQKRLKSHVYDRKWFLKEEFCDEVVEIVDTGEQDVYDFTVDVTHRYSAQGFVNHNSYVDFNLMARIGMPNCSIWSYSDHKAKVLGGKYSTNPYKLGFELLMDIEDRWNKGRFGKEYETCQDNRKKENWDLNLGLGKDKVFEVCKNYNDVTMIAEFFTEDFCRKNEFYNWDRRLSSEPGVEAEYKLTDRDWKKARNSLIQSRMNRGLPQMHIVDADGKGKNILVLQHHWDGRTLDPKYAKETMRSLSRLWRNPVAVLTKDSQGQDSIFYCYSDLNIVKILKRSEWLHM